MLSSSLKLTSSICNAGYRATVRCKSARWQCEAYSSSKPLPQNTLINIDTNNNYSNYIYIYILCMHNIDPPLMWYDDTTTTTITTVLRPFFWDHPGEPVPEDNFWTSWCKGRLTEADTLNIRLGATPSGLTSTHLHHPPFFTGRMPFLPPNQQHQSTEGKSTDWRHMIWYDRWYDIIW